MDCVVSTVLFEVMGYCLSGPNVWSNETCLSDHLSIKAPVYNDHLYCLPLEETSEAAGPV